MGFGLSLGTCTLGTPRSYLSLTESQAQPHLVIPKLSCHDAPSSLPRMVIVQKSICSGFPSTSSAIGVESSHMYPSRHAGCRHERNGPRADYLFHQCPRSLNIRSSAAEVAPSL